MSYQIQQQIKNNSADLRNYVEDLYDWEQQMSMKEKQKKNNSANETTSKAVPVRGTAQVSKVENQTKPEDNAQKEKLKRDANTVGDYYRAWDNFDIDKEIEDLDAKHKDEQMSEYVNPYAAMTSTKPRAAPRAQIRINSQRSPLLDVNSLKDKANLLYSSCNFKGADDLYSECIEKIKQYPGALTPEENLLFATIYSNRAMTLLKLQEYGKAEQDATNALSLQPKHVKSYLRRGTARKKLLKLKDALADFKIVVELQSDNTEAQQQIAVVNKLLTDKKDKAIHELLVESQDTEEFITVPVGDISGSDIEIVDTDDVDEDDDVIPKNSKFAHLKVIDKPAEQNDENSSDEEKNRDINFNKKVEELDLNKKTSYHKDEVPSHSILHNSHDLGHLVKAIDTKPLRHSAKTEEEISGNVSGVVKFGGEEIPVQSHTPVHNKQPRNSILKNSPLVQENFHAQIKDIDGKLLGHSKFKEEDQGEESKREASDVKSNGSEQSDDDQDDQEESFSVRFKKEKEEIESSTAPRHSFSLNGSTPKKHILKSNLEDATQLNQLHQKYFTDKSPTHGQNTEASFGYQSLKNIDGKQVQHERSPRNKIRFAEEDIAGDDKKVHFGGVQSVAKTNEQPKKEIKSRHSILKTQGTGGLTQETPVIENQPEKNDSKQENKETKQQKIERAIEQGVQKIKETIIEQASTSKIELTASKFLSEWSHLKGDNSARLQYLENVSAAQILTIFKEGMEIEVISEILDILSDSPILAKPYLLAFPQLKRFKLTVSCLSSQEKQNIKELIEKLKLNEEESNSIRSLYKIK